MPLAPAELLACADASLLPVTAALALIVLLLLVVSDGSAPEGDALSEGERLPRPLGLYVLLTVVATEKLAAVDALGDCDAVPK